MSVIDEIAAERRRQIEREGWSLEHDDQHDDGKLADAAGCYIVCGQDYPKSPPHWWPWARNWWKPTDRRRDLIKAAALIVAEVERLDRASDVHQSDCAIHNAPALEAGPCDCPNGSKP